MNDGWGPDAQYIAQGIIAFVETGFSEAAEAAEKLTTLAEQATSKMEGLAHVLGRVLTSAIQAPGRMIDWLTAKIHGLAGAISNSGIGQISRLLSFSGGLGLSGLFYGAARGTIEMQQFSVALRNLVNELGDRLAPYLRMATQTIIELTRAWKELSEETKQSITKWALWITGIATAIALLPTFISIIGAVVGAIGTLIAIITSPFTLFVAALAGAVVAADAAFGGEIISASRNAAEGIVDNTKTWSQYITDSLIGLVSAFGKFWNKVMEFAAKAATFVRDTWGDTVNWLARRLAQAGEWSGVLPKGTAKQLEDEIKRELKDRKPIDLGAAMFNLDNVGPNFRKFVDAIRNGLDFNGALARIQQAGQNANGFGRGQAQWEGVEDTWLRAQMTSAQTTGGPVNQIAGNVNGIKIVLEQSQQSLRRIEMKPGAIIP
jgi:hypothetical protein